MFWLVRKRAFGNGRSTYDGSSGEPGQVLSAISEPLVAPFAHWMRSTVVPLTDSTAKPGIVAWLSISHSARSSRPETIRDSYAAIDLELTSAQVAALDAG